MWFTSDNAAGAPPEVLRAVADAAEGYGMAYGADPWTERARAAIREAFEAPEAAVHFVATGTAANALALACLSPAWGSVFCHRSAHIEDDECGAPEFYMAGGKLVLIEGENGRMTPDALSRAIAGAPRDVHSIQPSAVSITQATEAGTVYSAAEVAALAAVAKDAGLPVHMDGARFANALAATGATPAEMSWKAGVDVLGLGFTKNGALAAEAIIVFDPAKDWELQLRRKRGGHLFSKMRFMTAQAAAMMEDDLWLRLAAHANRMASRLATGLEAIDGVELLHPVEANLMFARLPKAAHERAKVAGAMYYAMPDPPGMAPDGKVKVRLVASFQTREADVDGLLSALAG